MARRKEEREGRVEDEGSKKKERREEEAQELKE
jgi:hypothetical protein